jgi:gamma-glutamyl hercynylcysteine S-oxide synthase
MASDLIVPTEPARKSWASRVFGKLGGKKASGPSPASEAPGAGRRAASHDPGDKKVQSMAQRLIAEDRYVFVLLEEAADDIDDQAAHRAWSVLQEQMAMVPGGVVPLIASDGTVAPVELPAYYLDRCAVTNQQFQRFVNAGGYDDLEIWPREVWPSVMRLTDKTGQPGPRDWERGKFPAGKADHPVVGVCWYEALAYARWVGKRLPTAAEWQKAGSWPEHLSGGSCSRYPWGDIFDPRRANLWATGLGQTTAVREFPRGATPNGIYQLTGNVWEWLDDALESIPCRPDETFEVWKPLRRIAGGAFNTYFPAEATCQFITGQPELDRCDNIGFRCAVAAERLRLAP